MRRSRVVIALDRLERVSDRPVSQAERADLLRLLTGVFETPARIAEFLRVQADRRQWPSLGDVRRWARQTLPEACLMCEGTGWVLRTLHYGDGTERPAAVRCQSCSRERRTRRAAR